LSLEGGVRKWGVQTWTILGPKNRFIGKIFPPENEEKNLDHFEKVSVSFRGGITPLVVGMVMPQIPQLILPLKIGRIGPKKEAGPSHYFSEAFAMNFGGRVISILSITDGWVMVQIFFQFTPTWGDDPI